MYWQWGPGQPQQQARAHLAGAACPAGPRTAPAHRTAVHPGRYTGAAGCPQEPALLAAAAPAAPAAPAGAARLLRAGAGCCMPPSRLSTYTSCGADRTWQGPRWSQARRAERVPCDAPAPRSRGSHAVPWFAALSLAASPLHPGGRRSCGGLLHGTLAAAHKHQQLGQEWRALPWEARAPGCFAAQHLRHIGFCRGAGGAGWRVRRRGRASATCSSMRHAPAPATARAVPSISGGASSPLSSALRTCIT